MLVVNLVGGLGNQMFQYAFGQSLQHRLELLVKYDIADLLDRTPRENVTYRDFELSVFACNIPIAKPAEVAIFRHQPVGLYERGYYRMVRRLRRTQMMHETRYFVYDPSVWNTGPNAYFDGYWQSERYFQQHEKAIRQAFQFRHAPSGLNLVLAQQISEQQAIAVHVRRGDYVSNTLYNQVHGTCSPAYYERAVRYLTERVPNAVLYVFSDEPDWVRQHMSFDAPTVYVSHNRGKDSFEDMRLMSLCKHNVIANSSFSWWGAWLNANPHKIVVAPRQWQQHLDSTSLDLLPTQWTIL